MPRALRVTDRASVARWAKGEHGAHVAPQNRGTMMLKLNRETLDVFSSAGGTNIGST